MSFLLPNLPLATQTSLARSSSDFTRDAVRFSDGNAVPLCWRESIEDILIFAEEIIFENFKTKQFSTNGVQRNACCLFVLAGCLLGKLFGLHDQRSA
jgi:hypothetical protein